MWYKIDFDRLVLLLLPTFLRKPILFGFVRAIIAPVFSLHYRWLRMREENLAKLSYNGQRCYLRGVLNDKYDFDLRRITLENTLNESQDYIYTPAENVGVYLGTMWLEVEFNYEFSTVDFIVKVPKDIMNKKINEIAAVVDFYKLAGKRYEIIAI